MSFANEPTLELRRAPARESLLAALRELDARPPLAVPVLVGGDRGRADGMASTDPGRPSRIVARAADATAEDAAAAVEAAGRGSRDWGRRPAPERAEVLRAGAARLRERRLELAALQVRECAKPWAEADADVCEAIDFLEYYAEGAAGLIDGRLLRGGPAHAGARRRQAARQRRHRAHGPRQPVAGGRERQAAGHRRLRQDPVAMTVFARGGVRACSSLPRSRPSSSPSGSRAPLPRWTGRASREFFSPNGDGRLDAETISFRVKEAGDVTVDVVGGDGGRVRRLATAIAARPSRPVELTWDGRTDEGGRARDGRYRVRVALRRSGRSVVVPAPFVLDTTPPRPVVVRARPQRGREAGRGPAIVLPGQPVELTVRRVSPLRRTQFEVWRTDAGPRAGRRLRGAARGLRARDLGRPGRRAARPGRHLPRRADRRGPRGQPRLRARAAAAAARRGPRAPGGDGAPPRRPAAARAGPGRRARPLPRRLARRDLPLERPAGRRRAADPQGQRPAGAAARPPRARRPLGRLPARGPQRPPRDARAVPRPVARAGGDPRGAAGDQLARVRPRRRRRRRPARHPRGATSRVRFPRPLAGADGSGLPEGFATQTAPLLALLDRARVRYDVTTDLALAASRSDPSPTDREGVLLAGPHRWIPRALAGRLRRYAERGGRVASFGTETLRRGVTVARRRGRLERPTQPTQTDVFGARLRPLRRLEDAGAARAARGRAAARPARGDRRPAGRLPRPRGVGPGARRPAAAARRRRARSRPRRRPRPRHGEPERRCRR